MLSEAAEARRAAGRRVVPRWRRASALAAREAARQVTRARVSGEQEPRQAEEARLALPPTGLPPPLPLCAWQLMDASPHGSSKGRWVPKNRLSHCTLQAGVECCGDTCSLSPSAARTAVCIWLPFDNGRAGAALEAALVLVHA